MRRLLALAAVAPLLAGCGGGHNPSAAAARAVHDAYRQLLDVPVQSTAQVEFRYDTRGLPGPAARVFAPGRSGLSSQSQAENAARVASVTTSPGPSNGVRTVLYDGAVYVAAPGRSFKTIVAPLASAYRGLQVATRRAYDDAIVEVSDLGLARVEGTRLRHYRGRLSAAGRGPATARFLGTLAAPDGAFALSSSRIDVYMDPRRGTVAVEAGTLRGTLDLSQLDARVLAGTRFAGLRGRLGVTVVYRTRTEPSAQPIAIPRPRPQGTAATLAQLFT